MFFKSSLKTKMFLSFLSVSIFTILVGLLSNLYLNKVITNYEKIVQVNLKKQGELSQLRNSLVTIRSEMLKTIGFYKIKPNEIIDSIDSIQQEVKNFQKIDQDYMTKPFESEEEKRYLKLKSDWNLLKGHTEIFLKIFDSDGVDEKLVNFYLEKIPDLNLQLIEQINELIIFQNQQTNFWTLKSSETAKTARIVTITIIAIAIFCSMGIGFFISKHISLQLHSSITELNNVTPQLTTTSKEMDSLSENLTSSSTEQAAAIQETAASLEEMSTMLKRNSENVSSVQASSHQAILTCKEGINSIKNMSQAIFNIDKNNQDFNVFIEKNNSDLKEMITVINNIAEKTKVINEIVFQTKLLSFNASVEAARAGEHGKGFAVVAEEIGNLAVMSGNAANDITQLIDDSHSKVENIVKSSVNEVQNILNLGNQNIKQSLEVARECEASLETINSNVQEVERLISDVLNASEEQSRAVIEVTKAMNQIEQVTNQNTIAAEKVTSQAFQSVTLSDKINNSAKNLNQLLTGV